jgi:hypothetical protein
MIATLRRRRRSWNEKPIKTDRSRVAIRPLAGEAKVVARVYGDAIEVLRGPLCNAVFLDVVQFL